MKYRNKGFFVVVDEIQVPQRQKNNCWLTFLAQNVLRMGAVTGACYIFQMYSN